MKTNPLFPAILIPALLSLASAEPQERVPLISHKERIKRDYHKVYHPGRGKPAKGFDPVTKKWID
jgi:hypothetical protein